MTLTSWIPLGFGSPEGAVRLLRALGWGLLGLILLISMSGVAHAWGLGDDWYNHEAITDDVVYNVLGWGWVNQPMGQTVIFSNEATDCIEIDNSTGGMSFYLYAGWWYEADVYSLVSDASFNEAGTTDQFHFDNLYTFDKPQDDDGKTQCIDCRMKELNSWMLNKVDQLSGDCDSWDSENEARFLTLLGVISHAMEDFYCHSDWVGICSRSAYHGNVNLVAADFPTWDELLTNTHVPAGFSRSEALFDLKQSNNTVSGWDDAPGLQTGKWSGLAGTTALKWFDWIWGAFYTTPWTHRHRDGQYRDVGIELGKRATAQWFDRALMRLPCKLRNRFLAHIRQEVPPNATPPKDRTKLVTALSAGECGALKSGDRVNVFIVGPPSRSIGFTVSGNAVSDLAAEPHDCPDFTFVVTSEAISSILSSSDPVAAALAAEADSALICTRGGACGSSLAQSTFIDGTQGGLNCGTTPCWPGIRGDASGQGVFDNVNSPVGDSIVVRLATTNGSVGINWRDGYNVRTGALDQVNQPFYPLGYSAAYDFPRVIYRLFDPATKTWSALDSCELYADKAGVVSGTMLNVGGYFRFDWPPHDKVAAGAQLPNGFSVNGQASYSQLAFLPHGAKIQYTFKTVQTDGTTLYGLRELSPLGPMIIPGSSFDDEDDGGLRAPGVVYLEPTLFTFSVLPSVYPPGTAGTLSHGLTTTPLLVVDGSYLHHRSGALAEASALRGMGVRADLYRVIDPGSHRGNGIGGHELAGLPYAHESNFHPNTDEWGLLDSLKVWYRLVIVDSNDLPGVTEEGRREIVEDSDANVISGWWSASTGPDGGDRCILGMGSGLFDGLLNSTPTPPTASQMTVARDVSGLSGVSGTWSGALSSRNPDVGDLFASTRWVWPFPFDFPLFYGLEGRQTTDQFDALTPTPAPGIVSSASYWNFSDVAGVSRMTEKDAISDHDRNKALSYGYSLESMRKSGIDPKASNYANSGLAEQRYLLYKFLTGCRGARSGSDTSSCWPCLAPASPSAGSDTASCWPCPADSFPTTNWALDAAATFQIGTYGPIYLVQDMYPGLVTSVNSPPTPIINSLLQNRPNPFNPETVIPYSVAEPGHVSLRIYDVRGRCIRKLIDRQDTAGLHISHWNGETDDGTRAANGIYFYRIVYPDGTASAKKMAILR